MLFPDTEFLHTRVQNLSWLYLHPAKKKEPTENPVDPHCFSGKYNTITSKGKSQCKTSANFSSKLTSLFS